MEDLNLTVDVILRDPGFDADRLEELVAPFMEGTVELIVADPGYMKVMNRRFRHVNRATDVLAFDMRDRTDGPPEGVIYVDGRLYPPVDELLERIFHGYLHLMGYTHSSLEEADVMQREVAGLVSRAMESGADAGL